MSDVKDIQSAVALHGRRARAGSRPASRAAACLRAEGGFPSTDLALAKIHKWRPYTLPERRVDVPLADGETEADAGGIATWTRQDRRGGPAKRHVNGVAEDGRSRAG